jgi:predicted transposase YbfD/YdcC
MQDQISSIFSSVEDPRETGRCLHKLVDILFIAFCTVLSNGEDFEDMVEFGKQREEWLREMIELPNGIPSHDTFNRVLELIDSEHLKVCLGFDASRLLDCVAGKLISFDGKKIKGESPKSLGNRGLYILSAWANEDRICIGQKKIQDKSNEIVAIPELIDELELTGSTVSIDAIGCQTEIASKLLTVNANYLLAVKGNQKDLLLEISENFEAFKSIDLSEEWDCGHGRSEKRVCKILLAKEVLSPKLLSKWEGVETLVKIEAERVLNDVKSTETRYYISSQTETAAYYNNAVRGHWGIENQLHWHLDVTFGEDKSRSRSGNAPENLNILRKMSLHRITNMDDKLSLQKRRYRASMNTKYLKKVLGE